jgi:DNA polymerase-3 subunit delta'
MTTQAQNALLLTLEEPPAYARFLLLCENSELLLETIKSRAPILRTEPIPTDMIDAYISKNDVRAAQMKSSAPEDYAELLMAASFGIGRALELLDTKKLAPILENRRLVKDFLSYALGVERNPQSITLLRRFAQKRDALSEQIELLRLALRDLIVSKKSDSVTLCFFESRDRAAELCDATSIAHLFKISSAVDTAADRIAKNANVRLTLVSLLSDTDMI